MTFACYVTCDLCGRTETIQTTLIYRYLLPDNQATSSMATPVWCFDCNGIRDGERLPSAERLAEMLAELEANGLDEATLKDNASFLNITLDLVKEYENELATRRAALAWRVKRQSPPRCLDCGGINHRPLEYADGGYIHPGCNGMFRVGMEWHGSQGVFRELDPEGNGLSDLSK
jgi:hypothetical protein